jgi:ADP-L-glycero-D-manno-heptose 6-epimerase
MYIFEMIVITGVYGMIGGALLRRLAEKGETVVAFDKEQDDFLAKFTFWWMSNKHRVKSVYHMGAISDTTFSDEAILTKYNSGFTLMLFSECAELDIPLVYASSAATYGDGEKGFSDNHDTIPNLEPINLYARSKHIVDLHTISATHSPSFWAGLKFFNVYGHNESRKGRMASMVYHGYRQIVEGDSLRLFDGTYLRDFVYVEDVVDVMIWLMENRPSSGIYNVGVGVAEDFRTMGAELFKALGRPRNIEFIPMPNDLKGKYQTYTCADISKLRKAGYVRSFHTLEQGVRRYVSILKSLK